MSQSLAKRVRYFNQKTIKCNHCGRLRSPKQVMIQDGLFYCIQEQTCIEAEKRNRKDE